MLGPLGTPVALLVFAGLSGFFWKTYKPDAEKGEMGNTKRDFDPLKWFFVLVLPAIVAWTVGINLAILTDTLPTSPSGDEDWQYEDFRTRRGQ